MFPELRVDHPVFSIQRLAPEPVVGLLFLEPLLTPPSPNTHLCQEQWRQNHTHLTDSNSTLMSPDKRDTEIKPCQLCRQFHPPLYP